MARIAFTAGMAIAGNSAVHAAVWNESAQATLRAGYDDNPRMQTGDVGSTEYGAVDATAHSAYENESLSWTFDPRVVLVRYRDQTELNRTEAYANSALEKTFETAKYALSYNWTRDTTLTSERGSTSLAGVNKPHTASALTFSGQQSFTERLDSQGTLYASINRYSDAQNTGLVDYHYGAAQLDIGYAPSLQSRLSLNASIGRLEIPEKSIYNKTNQSLMLTYSRAIGQRWHTKFSAGPSQVKANTNNEPQTTNPTAMNPRRSRESGTLYSAELTRQSETTSLQLKIARDISPTGQGVLTRRQQVTLSANHAFSARWTGSVSGSMVKNDSLLLTGDLTFSGLKYSDENLSISWRWTPTVTLSFSGGYSDQLLQNANRSAHRTYAALNLSWNGMAHTFQ